MTDALILEILATISGLIFLFLLIQEKMACWIFGGISSILSVVLFYQSNLYSEAILYIFYTLMAVYGYVTWKAGKSAGGKKSIITIQWLQRLFTIIGGTLLAGTLGFSMNRWTDADYAYTDAFTTSFSIIATFYEAHKILFGWIIWMGVNFTSIVLYSSKSFHIYAGLMVIYFVMSIYGFVKWRKLAN